VSRRRRASAELPPWDPGLQNERTALAWVRTTLALAAAALVLARILTSSHLFIALALVVVCLVNVTWVGRAARERYVEASAALGENRPLPDARLPAVVTALTVVVHAGALLHVVTG
jgi:uncharacterized membrane protein YidH (DUF202 family)